MEASPLLEQLYEHFNLSLSVLLHLVSSIHLHILSSNLLYMFSNQQGKSGLITRTNVVEHVSRSAVSNKLHEGISTAQPHLLLSAASPLQKTKKGLRSLRSPFLLFHPRCRVSERNKTTMEFAQILSTLSTGPWKGFYFRELRYMARLVIQLLCSLLTTL